MAKTKIDEDKSTPLGDLHKWGRTWLERGVKTPELIGCLSLAKDFLSVSFLRALGGEGKKGKADDATPYNELREAVHWLRNEVSCRIEHGANGASHLMYVQGKLNDMLKDKETMNDNDS